MNVSGVRDGLSYYLLVSNRCNLVVIGGKYIQTFSFKSYTCDLNTYKGNIYFRTVISKQRECNINRKIFFFRFKTFFSSKIAFQKTFFSLKVIGMPA